MANVPAPLALFDTASLHLTETNGAGGAKLARLVSPGELDLSDHDWTFAGWFRRTTQTNEDFIFYIGNGDGFGANEELQLYGYPNAATLSLRHYLGENLTDVNLSVGGVAVGDWHHVALAFTRTNPHTGILRLYLNGALAGSATPQFNLDQSVPMIFGGHNNPTYAVWRWFNGQLDDLVLSARPLARTKSCAWRPAR